MKFNNFLDILSMVIELFELVTQYSQSSSRTKKCEKCWRVIELRSCKIDWEAAATSNSARYLVRKLFDLIESTHPFENQVRSLILPFSLTFQELFGSPALTTGEIMTFNITAFLFD